MDWGRPFEASYRFMSVSRDGNETGQVDGITGGTLTVNQDSAVYESADLDSAMRFDLGNDRLRCYLDATQDGTTESVCLGTWDVSIPSRSINGLIDRCPVYCDGLLGELQGDSFEAPVTVPTGSNIVSYAKGICEGIGLSVNATESDSALGTPWVFGLDGEQGGSKLKALNSLLSLAGYSSASTDPMGNVVLKPYQNPTDRNPVWTFEEGPTATFLIEAEEERDTRDVANVVLAIYESDGETTVGSAIDDDASSPYSIHNRGYRKVAKYTYRDTATQAQADYRAAELLSTAQSVIHRLTLKHVYCLARVGDVVRVVWPSKGINATFTIRTQKVEIGSAGCLTTSELRRFERRS